ncbi:MAG TPA: LuxR C-terminal-related transcriptional regulator [Solirubrobacteraceae bacterium]
MAGATKPGGKLLTIQQAAGPRLVSEPLEARHGAPRMHEELVCRTELLSRLDRARGYPLVLVTAPAGYGKTTLLAQWSARGERPVGWVALDAADSDPARLADSILTALEWIEIDPVCPEQDFALVFDDAHLVPPGVLGDAVLDVLGWLPQGSQVAVASRCEPALPLGRLRGHRMLVELNAEDLSMSSVEAASLLRKAGIDLEFTDVQDLMRRTEGWPVALALAANSIAGQPDAGEGLAQLAGDDHHISEYFRAEFLAALSPAAVRFLIRSSVLDRLSGPLCDAVLERERSAAVLARLERANVPLRPADRSHEWYSVHGLFREMLQTELRRADPDLQRALHRRAGDWHARAGDLDHAIGHARAAGDLERTGELLWANLPHYLGQGRNDAVQQWLGGITPEQAAACPPLALVAAHSQLASGNIALAEQWARSAAVALSGETAAPAKPQRAGALIIEAWAARSGATRMGEDAASAYDLLPDDSSWRASCCYLRGTSALLTGYRTEAERQFEEGAARGVSLAPEAASLCLAQLAVLALDQDDPEVAGDSVSRARNVIEQHDLAGHPTLALVFAASAAVDVSQGRFDEAKAAVSKCKSLIGMLDDFTPWYGAETRIVLARGSLALGDVSGAREQLAHASRLARRTLDVVVFQRWFDDAWDQFDKRAETALIGVGSLTTAELRVLRFLPTHFSFHEIAERLHVSSNTVKTHVHAVYRKLDASSRSQAVVNATRAGLLGC